MVEDDDTTIEVNSEDVVRVGDDPTITIVGRTTILSSTI